MVDEVNRSYKATGNPNATRKHWLPVPGQVPIVGMAIHEQSGYGIVDLQWLLPGGQMSKQAARNPNASQIHEIRIPSIPESGIIPDGWRSVSIRGFTIRVQPGYGIVDLRMSAVLVF